MRGGDCRTRCPLCRLFLGLAGSGLQWAALLCVCLRSRRGTRSGSSAREPPLNKLQEQRTVWEQGLGKRGQRGVGGGRGGLWQEGCPPGPLGGFQSFSGGTRGKAGTSWSQFPAQKGLTLLLDLQHRQGAGSLCRKRGCIQACQAGARPMSLRSVFLGRPAPHPLRSLCVSDPVPRPPVAAWPGAPCYPAPRAFLLSSPRR